MQVIDQLVCELDEFRSLNISEENHQIELLQQLSASCCEHDSRQAELREVTYTL